MAALTEGECDTITGKEVCICHTSGVGTAGSSYEGCDSHRHWAVNGICPSFPLPLPGVTAPVCHSIWPQGLKRTGRE